ncbi:amino acid ABC transporter substrate-binding protein [Alteromonas sp. V450]|uniref:amino acid ABC transporter substrate-binding protein n=1 Tax=Alteromonas sp. V450 TaxID=1912139 RepID=UPI0008FF7152|nr:amino acid ABC transporter substrate-binding protein [Alteromonas sp. V450]OJF69395.1 amino acid ABC transporter substrate-binding protein [Alteromonas sp. V450]
MTFPRLIAVLLLNAFAFGSIAAAQNAEPNVSSNEESEPSHTILRLPNVHPGRDAIYDYAKQLLTEALSVTEPQYGTFKLVVSERETAQERQLRSLEHNMLDITWSVTSIEREQYYLPIRIPIMAGLLGKRALLIKEGDERLNQVSSLEALREFRAVLGYDWPDTQIFRANNLPVLETTYRASFRIVSEGFADIFPRSVMEIKEELDDKTLTRGLSMSPNPIVAYPSPIFFFVSRDNPELAKRVTEGLHTLIKTGRFQTLLSNQQNYRDAIALLEGRTVIELENPQLSEQSREALDRFVTLNGELFHKQNEIIE